MCAHRAPTGVLQCTGTTSWIPIHSRRRCAGAVRALPRRVPVGLLLALAHGRFRSAARRLRRRLVHANQGSGACVRPPPSTRPAPAQHPPSTAAQHRRPAQQHPVLPREGQAARARMHGLSPGSKAQRAARVCGRYAPLKDGGALISGGDDLDQAPRSLWLYVLCPTSVTALT